MKPLTKGHRVAVTTPRGQFYATILFARLDGHRVKVLPDPGTTYGGAALTSMDVEVNNIEPTALPQERSGAGMTVKINSRTVAGMEVVLDLEQRAAKIRAALATLERIFNKRAWRTSADETDFDAAVKTLRDLDVPVHSDYLQMAW